MNTQLFLEALWSLGKISTQAGVLVVIVLLVQRLFRHQLSPRWRCTLWLLVMARLCLPISLSSEMSVFNLLPRFPAKVEVVQGTVSTVDTFIPQPTPQAEPDFNQPPGPEHQAENVAPQPSLEPSAISPPIPDAILFPPQNQNSAPSLEPTTNSWHRSWPILLLAAWLAGVVGLAAWVMVTTFRLWPRLAKATPITDRNILDLLAECCQQMRTHSRLILAESPHIHSPALYGLFRPKLLLPTGFFTRFSPQELRFIFLHELAHLKRRDLWLNWLVTLLQIVHWFNPLLWYGFARWRLDRELACDALVLETAGAEQNKDYGRTILHLLDHFTSRSVAPGLVGILEDQRQLKQRIDLIANFQPAKRWSLIALLLLVGLGLTTLTDATQPSQEKSTAVSGGPPESFMEADEAAIVPSNTSFYLPISAPENETLAASKSESNSGTLNLRLYRIDTPALTQHLQQQLGHDDSSQPLERMLSDYLTTQGDRSPSHWWFNQRASLLLGRASLALLGRVERDFSPTITTLRQSSPQTVVSGTGAASHATSSQLTNKTFRFDPHLLIQNMEAFYARKPTLESSPSSSSDARLNWYIESGEFLKNPIYDYSAPVPKSVWNNSGGFGLSGTIWPTVAETPSLQDYVRDFFTTVTGINFGRQSNGPFINGSWTSPGPEINRPLYFNDRSGVLFIRGTPDELDAVETVLQFLNLPLPAQVKIQATLFVVPEGSTTTGVSPLLDPVLKNGPGRNLVRLTTRQSHTILETLKRQTNIQELSISSVVTFSGQPAKLDLTGYFYHNTPLQTNLSLGRTNRAIVSLDVIPHVKADGYTIQLITPASTPDLIDYSNPGAEAAARFDAAVQALQAGYAYYPTSLPRFLLRQLTANVLDGQAVVLGGLISGSGLISDDEYRRRNHIPVLGDIPLLGRLFRSEIHPHSEPYPFQDEIEAFNRSNLILTHSIKITNRNQILIFITPTIVDPAGNPVHSADKLPYDPNQLPP